MKLSIIIVSWNVRDDLVRRLRSIEENRPMSEFEIIVIDNASSDGTVDSIKQDFPEANKENRGFAAANNQGIKKARGQYLFFLKPDTIVHPLSLDVLMNFMDGNSDAGACGSKLLNDDGTTQPSVRRFPTFRGALYRHTVFRFLGIFRSEYKKWLMKDFNYDREMDVDEVTGAALMVRRSVIDRIVGMDESFFMYYEEVDLCYRIKQNGWRFFFIDNERTKKFYRLLPWLRLKNLVQLNMHRSPCLTNSDRMRFFKAYLEENHRIRSGRSWWVKKVNSKTNRRLKKRGN